MLRTGWGVVLVALVAGLGLAWAQFPAPVTPQTPISGQISDIDRDHGDEPYLTRELQQRQLKRLREQHQHEVLTDTARMVQLAAALKDEVRKGNKAMLTADVMKDADEISKLAKRVSDRIKTQ